MKRLLILLALALVATPASAQQPAADEPKPSMEIYGFAMLDIGQNFKTIHPDWFDTMRVTQLPSYTKQFGEDNRTFASVRQTRFGVRTSSPTSLGELKTQFEFEMFGTGADAGQTTIRLRHAYGELGKFGAGQYWSPFMDIDVFPNSLEYWGPTGMVFFRNVQVRWMPIKSDTRQLTLALERPGASNDNGRLADRIDSRDVTGRFPMPDISGHYRVSGGWGHLQVAGMLRKIAWDDNTDGQFDLSGDAIGWGVNVSSSLKPTKGDVVRLQLVYGEGIQNYMNDSPVDLATVLQPSLVAPVTLDPIPIVGVVAFLDHSWTSRLTSAVGYSFQDNDNRTGQTPDAFRRGHYALGNLLYSPVPNVLVGGELQWGRRENYLDGFSSDGVKLQFSFKYNFSARIGGK